MSDTAPNRPYDVLMEHLREAEVLGSVIGLLSWDQETMMPPRGTPLRAQQISLLSGVLHQRRTDPRLADLIAACEADDEVTADEARATNMREIRRQFERSARLPVSLVQELADVTTRAIDGWRDARERSDFGAFAPWLQRVLDLTRTKAELLHDGASGPLYDALLEDYEPGATSSEIADVFADLRGRLRPFIAAIADSGVEPARTLFDVPIPIAEQVAFNTWVAGRIGFDLSAGRLDTSTHPFCQGVGAGDTRITTRYQETGFPDALSSTLHEGGHALYEQGLPKAEYPGQPLSEPASLGIHESQSRMWENMVGRSRAFWSWALPEARARFGEALAGVELEEAYRSVNRVKPQLIRVDSDEATYNLHIMLRFDLERALLAGDLQVRDLPGAWNERVRADLGVEVPDDRRGVLQDIHWGMGAIGYFATYTLGNLYAAQLWEALGRDLPDRDERIARGDFRDLLAWLRERVHRHGRRYSAAELCRRATGEELSAEPFLRYLGEKLGPIYGVAAP